MKARRLHRAVSADYRQTGSRRRHGLLRSDHAEQRVLRRIGRQLQLDQLRDGERLCGGTSNTYSGGVLVATGTAAGTAHFMPSQGSFAPGAQLGYFQHFAGSNWLWGAKFNYSYLGTTAATSSVVLPQSGAFTSGGTTNAVYRQLAAVILIKPASTVKSSLPLFIGRSFDRGFFYLGAGLTVSLTQTYLNGVTGFADINGAHTQITGTPTNLSSSGWVWGGAMQIGATYFLDPTWFLDLNYTYSMTANQTGSYEAPFTNSSMTEVGTLSGNSTGRVIAQALTLSINKTFSWGAR